MGHALHIGRTENTNKILIEKSEEKRAVRSYVSVGKYCRNGYEIGCGVVNWIELVEDTQ